MAPISRGQVGALFEQGLQGVFSSGVSSLNLLGQMVNVGSCSTMVTYPDYQHYQQYQQQLQGAWSPWPSTQPSTTLTAAPPREPSNQDWLDDQVEKVRVRL
jgi:hypothetical protein